MSKFCTQCGTENINEAKFCKSCGHSLIEKSPPSSPDQVVIKSEPIQEKVDAVNTENKHFIADYWHWIIGIAIVVLVPIILVPTTNKHNNTATAPVDYSSEAAPVAEEAAPAAEATDGGAELSFPVAEEVPVVLSEIEKTENACNAGNASACYLLGYMYGTGQGAEQNYKKEALFLKKGCDNGSADSCVKLGYLYDIGEGVAKNYSQAAHFYKKGCDGGNSTGCGSLGGMYALGQGVKQDVVKAFPLLKIGCNGENADACTILGMYYEEGLANDIDYSQAAHFYKKGCDGGNSTGCDQYEKLQSQGY